MIEKLKSDLVKYRSELEGLNIKLDSLEKQKQSIIQVGTRIEGVIAYLSKAIEDYPAEAPKPDLEK
jgi:molybdenum cofactor biosynthesis enzyme MoaA